MLIKLQEASSVSITLMNFISKRRGNARAVRRWLLSDNCFNVGIQIDLDNEVLVEQGLTKPMLSKIAVTANKVIAERFENMKGLAMPLVLGASGEENKLEALIMRKEVAVFACEKQSSELAHFLLAYYGLYEYIWFIIVGGCGADDGLKGKSLTDYACEKVSNYFDGCETVEENYIRQLAASDREDQYRQFSKQAQA